MAAEKVQVSGHSAMTEVLEKFETEIAPKNESRQTRGPGRRNWSTPMRISNASPT